MTRCGTGSHGLRAAIQVRDAGVIEACRGELQRSGIASACVAVDALAGPLPPWVEDSAGGLLLLVDEQRFERAMAIIGMQLGCTG